MSVTVVSRVYCLLNSPDAFEARGGNSKVTGLQEALTANGPDFYPLVLATAVGFERGETR